MNKSKSKLIAAKLEVLRKRRAKGDYVDENEYKDLVKEYRTVVENEKIEARMAKVVKGMRKNNKKAPWEG